MNLKKSIIIPLAILLCGTGAAFAFANVAESSKVESLLQQRLPKTKITSVDCKNFGSICEVVAGKSIFYTDHSARYLVIGRVYDLEERADLTASRLIELDPGALVGGAARTGQGDDSETANAIRPSSPVGAVGSGMALRVDLSKLSDKGAIKWGRGKLKATIFTDFRCGYCRMLIKTLEGMNVSVVERPISILGSRAISEAVICASNPKKALRAAYEGRNIAKTKKCDTSGLDENERFARANRISGTPVIVRADGAVMSGSRDRTTLENWLKGGK